MMKEKFFVDVKIDTEFLFNVQVSMVTYNRCIIKEKSPRLCMEIMKNKSNGTHFTLTLIYTTIN